MRRCPTCNRTYTDDSQKFCLEDGATLIEDAPASFDPQATIAMPGGQPTTPPSNPYGSGPGSYGAGAGGGQGSYGSGQGSYGSGAGQSYGSGAGQQQQQQTPSWSPTPPAYSAAAPAKKKSILPWILGGAAVVLVGFIGLVVAIVLLASGSNSNSNSNSNNSNSNSRSNSNSNSNSNRSNTNTRVSSGTTITSTDGKVQITAPSTWKTATDLNDKAELQASDTTNQMYLIVLIDNRSDYSSRMTLEGHSEQTLGALTRSMTTSNKIGPTSLTVNGNPALQYEVRGEIKGLNVVYLHTTVQTAKNFHQIVAWTLQTTYEAKKDTLQDIIQSFKEN